MKKVIKNNLAVSEVLATVLLLGIAISIFSVLSFIVLSFPFEPSTPTVNLVSYIDDNNITIDHLGGESIGLDTKIIIRINNSKVTTFTALEVLDLEAVENGFWNLGEKIVIDASKSPIGENITNALVDLTVVDIRSNSVVLMGILQEAT